MKILITGGATREPIDTVRYITNMSTGRTAKILAEKLSAFGHEVIYVHGAGALVPDAAAEQRVRLEKFESFTDLNNRLQKILSEEKIDAVLHAAAVSDYSVDAVRAGEVKYNGHASVKIDSTGPVEILLRRNFKIVERLKHYAIACAPLVVAFKLTSNADAAARSKAVSRLYESGNVDLVVHNDLTDILPDGKHVFRVIRQNGLTEECGSAALLAEKIQKLLKRD